MDQPLRMVTGDLSLARPTGTSMRLQGRVLLSFVEAPVEAAYQVSRAEWAARGGRAAVGAVALFLLAFDLVSFASDGPSLWLQRGLVAAQVVYLGIVALWLTRQPERAGLCYDAAMAVGMAYMSLVFALTHDRLSDLFALEQGPLRPAFFLEANSAVLLCGVSVAGPLLLRVSPGVTLLTAHFTAAALLVLRLFLGSSEHGCLAGEEYRLPPESAACVVLAAEIYSCSLVAVAVRCREDAAARGAFSAAYFSQKVAEAHQEEDDRAQAMRLKEELQVNERPQDLRAPLPEPISQEEDVSAVVLLPGPDALRPNAKLVQALAGKEADWDRIRRMAERIQTARYGLREYYDDCIASFPELHLFVDPRVNEARSTSGSSNAAEYQRTVGALFAVYWLLRLPVDGRNGWCYGVNRAWEPLKPRRVRGARGPSSGTGSAPRSSGNGASSAFMEPPVTSFAQMSEEQKRASFHETMNWSMFENLISQAGCTPVEAGSTRRIMAMLCLTAFHDIMKIEDLLPAVQPEHAPYMGYQAGDVIRDHDIALSYVLEHYPDLLPSYAGLQPAQRKVVMFTQGKMNFNHGWFVQAEAPPGAMLSPFKSVLQAGATPSDIGFYFFHWFTDLAGAEATPLGGAEKFVLRFPHAVLASFLWSIPFLGKLSQMSETSVVESYLRARWAVLAPDTPAPTDETAVAILRLSIMAQRDDRIGVIFRELPRSDRSCLSLEMARTGCVGQRFSTSPQVFGGPAILIYYSPALMQKNVDGNLYGAMRVLAEVLRAGRALWPLTLEAEGKSVTVNVAELKGEGIDAVVAKCAEGTEKAFILRRHNDQEGIVELINRSKMEQISTEGGRFHPLDFSRVLARDACNEVPSDFSDNDEATSAGGVSVSRMSRASRSSDDSEATKTSKNCEFAFPDLGENKRGTLAAESELAGLRQENWLLKDRVDHLNSEIAKLQMQLLRVCETASAAGEEPGGSARDEKKKCSGASVAFGNFVGTTLSRPAQVAPAD